MMYNLENMRERLHFQGGIYQEDRMINDKHRTFLKALKYSYQGCDIQKISDHSSCELLENQPIFRALINPNKLKQDYDDKILSVDKRVRLKAGDIFSWVNTNSYWIVTLEELTEDAYFRSEIRRCKHKINFKDKYGNFQETWAAIRGPVETTINSIQKNQIRVDSPNWSLSILIPANPETQFAFDRYKEFLFAGKCWQVQTVNSISMDNILEINANEYYINRDTDDIEHNLKDGLVFKDIEVDDNNDIKGHTFIKPKIEEKFSVLEENGKWNAFSDNNCKVPVNMKITNNGINCFLTWDSAISGQFNLEWVSEDEQVRKTKVVVVESLF